MNPEIAILSEVRQKENEGNHMTSLMCEIKKGMMQMNLHNRKRLIDLENEFMVAGAPSPATAHWQRGATLPHQKDRVAGWLAVGTIPPAAPHPRDVSHKS